MHDEVRILIFDNPAENDSERRNVPSSVPPNLTVYTVRWHDDRLDVRTIWLILIWRVIDYSNFSAVSFVVILLKDFLIMVKSERVTH